MLQVPHHDSANPSGSRTQPLPVAGEKRRRGGFTLVEILTATAIMALIVSLVMTILTQVLSAWNRSTDDLTLSTAARQILDFVGQDMQSAIFRNDGKQWLSVTTEVPAGTPISNAQNSRLIFYTSSPLHQSKDNGSPGTPGNPISGDDCAVEYRVTYADPFGNISSPLKTFSLHRVVIDPASTYFGISNQNNAPIMGIGKDNANGHSLPSVFDTIVDQTSGQPTTSNTPGGPSGKQLTTSIYGAYAYQSSLWDNVAQFSVALYYYGYNPSTAPKIQVYPVLIENPANPANYCYGGSTSAGAASSKSGATDSSNSLDLETLTTPVTFLSMAYADITITILTDDGVVILQTSGGALPAGMTWNQFIEQYGKTYTHRVTFLNKPH